MDATRKKQPQTITGRIVNPRLAHWDRLLAQWITNFERSCDLTGTTPAWNAPEGSNRSAFEGAAWQIGWIAMDETTCRRASKKNNCRADCYLVATEPHPPAYIEYKGEKIGPWAVATSVAEAALSRAVKEAAEIPDLDVTERIGVVFCNVFINRAPLPHIEKALDDVRDTVARTVPATAMAWCFPASALAYQDHPELVSAGVIVLARVVA